MSAEIHTTASTISENAAESTFHEVDDRERAIPAIEFRNVVLAFDERIILNNLSFKVMKGETKIILGGSGGGKSTIIKLVLGLLKPDEGQVLVEGEDVTNYTEDQMMKVRKNIGMVFQEGALFDSLSVYDNVTVEDGVFCGPSMVFTNVYNPRSAVSRSGCDSIFSSRFCKIFSGCGASGISKVHLISPLSLSEPSSR